ncbi:hypothetical protein SDC9_104973 [bioreactor metagenome]|uniref:Uncharacterized protein n=1 Tax=bioreactor metagenome TaxID=1076179 RepID=A0A645B8Y8_9ZZZZ
MQHGTPGKTADSVGMLLCIGHCLYDYKKLVCHLLFQVVKHCHNTVFAINLEIQEKVLYTIVFKVVDYPLLYTLCD